MNPILVADPNGPPPAILIMPLRADAALAGSAHAIDEMILAAVGKDKHFQVLGPEDLNALLGAEKMKDAAGCDDVACAAQLGGAMGAPYLIAGQLSPLGEEAVLSLRLLDTRSAKVLGRGGARGPKSADGLSQIMAQALTDLLGVRVAELRDVRPATATATATPVAPTATYGAYQQMATTLGRALTSANYTQLLQAIDGYERQDISAPPGQSTQELLVFYRATGCFMLKRAPCLEHAAARYLQTWPQGSYAQAVNGYLAQIDTVRAQQEDRLAALQTQLADIQAKQRAGHLSQEQALEISAGAAMGAIAYKRAADFYGQLMNLAGRDDERWFTFASQRATALEQIGEFAQVRQILDEAQRRNPRLFSAKGLNQTAARLPR